VGNPQRPIHRSTNGTHEARSLGVKTHTRTHTSRHTSSRHNVGGNKRRLLVATRVAGISWQVLTHHQPSVATLLPIAFRWRREHGGATNVSTLLVQRNARGTQPVASNWSCTYR